MKTLFGVFVVIAIGGSVVQAAPRKILVLPLDGNVDQATRARLNGSVLRMAKTLPGAVTVADTTFDETAAAVGCDPAKPACAETVRATLAVDEIVFGRATSAETTTLVVRRVRQGGAPMMATATVGIDDSEATTDAALGPAFGITASEPAPEPAPLPPVETPIAPAPPAEHAASTRTRGILITIGGGTALVAGLVLWSSVANAQDEIDDADPRSDDDFRDLRAKEDRAQRNAILGDVFFVAGLGLTAWGIVTLYRDHQARRGLTLAPRVSASTAGFALEGRW